MIYGYTIEPHKPDPLVELAETAFDQFSASTVPGAWLVDVIPARKSLSNYPLSLLSYLAARCKLTLKSISVRYMPEWVPGAGFKRTAREWRKKLREVRETPLLFTRKQLSRGKYEKSFVADFLNKAGDNLSPEDEYVVKWTAVSWPFSIDV